MNRKPLIGLVFAIGLICVGALAATAIWILKKQHGDTASVRRLPAQSFLVVQGNFAQLRASSFSQPLRRLLLEGRSEALPNADEVSREYRDLVQQCGFDPWVKLDGFTVGVDRDSLTGRSQSSQLAYLSGTFTEPEGVRCLEYLARRGHAAVQRAEVAHHPVYMPLGASEQPGPRTLQLHFMPRATLIADRTYMPTALDLAYGARPGLAPENPVARMLERLGRDSALLAAVDLAQLRAQNVHTVDQAVDELVRANPEIPDLTIARQAQTGGAVATLDHGGVTVTVRAEFPAETAARPFSVAVQQLIQRRKPEYLQGLDQMGTSLAAARLGAALLNPQLRSRFDQLDAGLALARQLPDLVRVTADGRSTVLTLPLTEAQVTTLSNATQAAAAVFTEMVRSQNNGLGGVLGGRPPRDEPQGQPEAAPSAVPAL